MLGSRKLLIFGIVSAALLSLFVVCASAEEFVREDPLSSFGVSPPFRSVQVPEYRLTVSGLSSFSEWLVSEGYTSSSNKFVPAYQTYYVDLDNSSGNGLVGGIWSQYNTVYVSVDGQPDHGLTSSRTLGFDSPAMYDFFMSDVGLSETDFVYHDAPATIFALALGCFSSILGVGSQLVSFVIARPIILIPLVAMVLFLSYGVIRRLIKGV